MTTKTRTNNFVDLMLTETQAKVYKILSDRYQSGKLTTRSDVEKALGGKEKSWVWRILNSLSEKGLVERYEQKYYKLKFEKTFTLIKEAKRK